MVVTTMRCVLVRFILVHVTSLLSLYRGGGGREGGGSGWTTTKRRSNPTNSLSLDVEGRGRSYIYSI